MIKPWHEISSIPCIIIQTNQNKTVWTIGHSTRSMDEFLALLQSFNMELVADIRSFPGSRRYPHFNKEALETSLLANGINYLHIKELGGRRAAKAGSVNTAWRHPAFKGYADYMQTDDFKKGIETLEQAALIQRAAYMCSEAVWWSCHRSMVSDYLKLKGWGVFHIMSIGKVQEHPYTAPARIIQGELRYDRPD